LDYDGSDKLIQKEVCSYNGMDDKVLETVYDGSGALVKKTVLTYNKKGLVIEKRSVNSKGEFVGDKKINYEF
jgi:hypothetical protein